LRNTLREADLEYKVVKNTLALKATEGTPLDGAKELFSGPVGLAFGYDDPVLLARKIIEFNKANEKLKIKGGVIEGGFHAPEEIKKISELPTRETLLATFIGAMQSPLARFANVLNATVARFIHAMNALREQRESGQ